MVDNPRKNMSVFVVLVDAMGGEQFSSISAVLEDARGKLGKVTFGANPQIRELLVLGEQPDEHVVYSGEYYDPGYDVHFFQGIYGNREAAREAVGKNGLILKHTI